MPEVTMQKRHKQVMAWPPTPERDLLEVWRNYATIASLCLADGWIYEIAGAAERTTFYDRLGQLRPECGPAHRSLVVHPYTIFYRTVKEEEAAERRLSRVEIIRVLREQARP